MSYQRGDVVLCRLPGGIRLLDRLTGQTSPFCDDGQLESGKHKSNQTLVWEDCCTPVVQLW